MLNLNFNSALRSTTHLGVPSFGGMPAAPGAGFGGLDALLAQTMQQLTQSMFSLMAQMAKQTSLLGGVKFGGGGQGDFGSPLVDFLGGTNGSLTTGRPAKAPKGSRIPGGKAIYRKGMFHKGAPGAPNTYAFENSPAGIAFAAKKGYSSIDLDMQITKDGVPVATH